MSRADLTPKQAAFVREYVKCGNASEAYRRAYDAGKMKPDVINVKAAELLKHGGVAVRLKEFQDKANEKAGVRLVDHLERMADLAKAAEQQGQFSAAIRAEELRAKASGLYTEKVEHLGKDGAALAPAIVIVPATSKDMDEWQAKHIGAAGK